MLIFSLVKSLRYEIRLNPIQDHHQIFKFFIFFIYLKVAILKYSLFHYHKRTLVHQKLFNIMEVILIF